MPFQIIRDDMTRLETEDKNNAMYVIMSILEDFNMDETIYGNSK